MLVQTREDSKRLILSAGRHKSKLLYILWKTCSPSMVSAIFAATFTLTSYSSPNNFNASDESNPIPPHIVVLIADDLGVGFAPCFADPGYMPHLSRLCKKSIVFTKAYTHPICTPSRAAMMTGRHTFRTRSGEVTQSAFKLGLDETTIPELIRAHSQAPYRFASFGKWHLASDQTGGALNPNLQGFDYFEGTPRQHHTYRYFNYEWVVNGERVSERVETYKTTQIVDRVIAHFTESANDSPWLYWIGFVNPHLPFHLPPHELHDFHNLKSKTFRSVWSEPKSENEIRINRPAPKVVPYYQAMVQALDSEIIRLVEFFTARSDRPILFFFLGDNGDAGEVAPRDRTGFRGAKAMLYETGVRVPLMVWSTAPAWAKQFAGETNRLTHLADLFPTLSEIAGVSPQILNQLGFPIDGVSFAGSIINDARSIERKRLYLQRGNPHNLPFMLGAVADNGHKLILHEFNRKMPQRTSLIEFFNLQQDPGESKNLFPTICHNDPAAFWSLFNYIAELHTSEKTPYGKFDEKRYRGYIEEQFATQGCSVGG